MLKKMKWRFVLSAMLAFFAVIMLVAILVNYVNYNVMTQRIDKDISYIWEKENRGMPQENDLKPPKDNHELLSEPFMPFPDIESNYMTRFFIVRFDSEGEVKSVYTDHIAAVDSGEATNLAKQALNKNSSKGFINEYRYSCKKINGSNVVVFMNAAKDIRTISSLQKVTILVVVGSLILVFILVYLFSGRAIKPIISNIERQKQFITDASHELKTPLTSISTSVDVLEADRGEDEWTENIRNQTGRMSKLVGELVALSKLDEEIPLPAKEKFSLTSAAWEIVEVFQPQAKAHEKNFETNIQDDIDIFGEKNAIQQMLSVLIDNAIKYSDEKGQVRISISKKKNKACIEVFNTCKLDNIPDEEKLFDRFYRPDASRSTNEGGNGVGLAIAKAVAEAHGGKISASCPNGKTMTIKVII